MQRTQARIWNRVEGILGSGVRLALATTGGGSELAAWLLNHPGASRAMVEVLVPYHPAALRDFLGAPGPHRVEEKTALHMAERAFGRVRELAGSGGRAIGAGCTAALATGRPRRGEDRAHFALRLEQEYRIRSVRFARGAADRLEQEQVLSLMGLLALAEACGVGGGEERWPEYADLAVRVVPLDDPVELVLRGEIDAVEVDAGGRASVEVARRGRLLFPGSFNPLHQGHVRLAETAGVQSGLPVCLEISVANVDKPPLSRRELEQRLAQLRGRFPAVITRAPTFLEKARLFGDCTFVIGYDTAARLFEAKYYENGEEGMARALEEMAAAGCRFLVAGRLHQGVYRTLDDLSLPGPLRGRFQAVPEEAFRADISSTEIREGSIDRRSR